MSTSFSSNQYESAFLPSHLQNYEVPRKFKEFPTHQRGCTQIIANNKGHILPQYHNRRTKSAWGHFMGTWQQPKKPVSLRVRTKLMAGHGLQSAGIAMTRKTTPEDGIVEKLGSLEEHDGDIQQDGGSCSQNSSFDSLKRTISRDSTGSCTRTTPIDGIPQSRPLSRTSSAAASTRSSSACSIQSNSPGRTPYNHLPGSASGISERSSLSGRSTPKSSSSIRLQSGSNRPILSSGSSRVSSAPVQTRSSCLSKNSSGSPRVQSPEQKGFSDSPKHDESGVQEDDAMLVAASSFCSNDSRSSSRSASIAMTTSTKSGAKCRGVQCSGGD